MSVAASDFDGFYCPSTRAPLDTPLLKPPEEGGDEPLPPVGRHAICDPPRLDVAYIYISLTIPVLSFGCLGGFY